MKIACIGNMNNNMFCIVRYLRDMGYDAHLLLINEQDLFYPNTDTYIEEYKTYTHQLDWYNIWHWNISKKKIKNDLKGFDFIIACDHVPAFLWKAGIHLDLLVPAGSEMYHWPFYQIPRRFPKKSDINRYYYTYCYRKSVKNASYINFDAGSEFHEDCYKRLNPNGIRIKTNPPFLYVKQYTESVFKQLEQYNEIQKTRNNYNFIVIQHCRQSWYSLSKDHIGQKANNILIKGFADFLLQTDDKKKNLLILFEYGPDVDASKKLVEELGIQDHVKWLPKMYRKDLMPWLGIANIGVGELGDTWFSYGAVYEFLSLKVPFIGYRNDYQYKHLDSGLYPMVSAPSVDEICNTFLEYKKNPEKFKAMGIKAFEWFNQYAIEKPLNEYRKIIEERKKQLDFD